MTRPKTDTDVLGNSLLKDCASPEDIVGEHGLLHALTKRLVERALHAGLTTHLGYAPHAPEWRGSGNSRNGTTGKTVKTDQGPLPLEILRDRQGSFAPQLVKKRQRRLEGFVMTKESPCMPADEPPVRFKDTWKNSMA